MANWLRVVVSAFSSLFKLDSFTFKFFRMFSKTHIKLTTLEGKSFLLLKSHIISVGDVDTPQQIIDRYSSFSRSRITFLTMNAKDEEGKNHTLFVVEPFYYLTKKLA